MFLTRALVGLAVPIKNALNPFRCNCLRAHQYPKIFTFGLYPGIGGPQDSAFSLGAGAHT